MSGTYFHTLGWAWSTDRAHTAPLCCLCMGWSPRRSYNKPSPRRWTSVCSYISGPGRCAGIQTVSDISLVLQLIFKTRSTIINENIKTIRNWKMWIFFFLPEASDANDKTRIFQPTLFMIVICVAQCENKSSSSNRRNQSKSFIAKGRSDRTGAAQDTHTQQHRDRKNNSNTLCLHINLNVLSKM